MKPIALRWLAPIILLVLALSAAGPASPAANFRTFDFNVGSAYGDRDIFRFTINESGCILAQIKPWSRSGTRGLAAEELALILNGSDRTGYYARNDGSASNVMPLWTSFAVSPSEVERVNIWTISVVNFTRRGTARGTIELEYPRTQIPCELIAAASQMRGRIDLSWRYTGRSFSGSFLIERSTNAGRTWNVVRACTESPTTSSAYSCSDTGLTSGRTYYYRACAITSGSRCKTTNLTPPVMVRVP